MVYYKLRQVLQSAMDLLQIATGITKCDDYYKLRQYTPPPDNYCTVPKCKYPTSSITWPSAATLESLLAL